MAKNKLQEIVRKAVLEALAAFNMEMREPEPKAPPATSNEDLMLKLLKQKAPESQIYQIFLSRYNRKGITNKKWITARVDAYKRLAEKKLSRKRPAA